jgi:hypothetical protein
MTTTTMMPMSIKIRTTHNLVFQQRHSTSMDEIQRCQPYSNQGRNAQRAAPPSINALNTTQQSSFYRNVMEKLCPYPLEPTGVQNHLLHLCGTKLP